VKKHTELFPRSILTPKGPGAELQVYENVVGEKKTLALPGPSLGIEVKACVIESEKSSCPKFHGSSSDMLVIFALNPLKQSKVFFEFFFIFSGKVHFSPKVT
jgi:hypothetical protein